MTHSNDRQRQDREALYAILDKILNHDNSSDEAIVAAAIYDEADPHQAVHELIEEQIAVIDELDSDEYRFTRFIAGEVLQAARLVARKLD